MSKTLETISDELAEWLYHQHIFFVATAPLAGEGHINCSPKGGDCFRVLGPMDVAYQDYTGSGAETAAHVQENGRIVLMFCAFTGRPEIVRLHGRADLLTPGNPGFEALDGLFPCNPGTRAIFRIQVARISTSCGFSVPLMEFRQDREALDKWAASKGSEALDEYRAQKNTRSIDGLHAFASSEEN